MDCLARLSARMALLGQTHRRPKMDSGLEVDNTASKAVLLNRNLGSSFHWSNYMPSCMEIIKCACRLSWLYCQCLFSFSRAQEKMLSELPQPYWRQKRNGVQTPGPWWTKSLPLWVLIPAILGAQPSISMSSERPAFRTECRERVGLRSGYQEKESRQNKPSRPMSSESILANYAESPIPAS